MLVVKKKILLERFRSRKTPLVVKDSVIKKAKGKCKDCGDDEINLNDGYTVDYGWGTITASTIPIRLFMTQNMDDIGMFSDVSFTSTTPSYTVLESLRNITISSVLSSPESVTSLTEKLYLRNSDKGLSSYYTTTTTSVSGYTDDKIDDVTSVRLVDKYAINKNKSDDPKNYWSGLIKVDNNNTELDYLIDANNVDTAIDMDVRPNSQKGGSPMANTGIQYFTDKNIIRTVTDGKCYGCDEAGFKSKTIEIFSTSMKYNAEGWNQYNTTLSAITKNEMFFGITSPPEVMSDVFIDRGVSSPMEHHLRLNDIGAVEEFNRYGNKFYNIITY